MGNNIKDLIALVDQKIKIFENCYEAMNQKEQAHVENMCLLTQMVSIALWVPRDPTRGSWVLRIIPLTRISSDLCC